MTYVRLVGIVFALLAGAAGVAEGQRIVTQADRVVSVSKGNSALLIHPLPIARFSAGDPGIAEANVISPTEVILNGKGLGTTTLFDGTTRGRCGSTRSRSPPTRPVSSGSFAR